jgi:hypothetical protein
LKKALTSAPLLSPPDYGRDFLLYLAAAESTIGMVLVQEDDALSEHVIYYLSRGLVGPELRYSPIEKLALAAVHVVQRLRHYILLRKTFVLVAVNPFLNDCHSGACGGHLSGLATTQRKKFFACRLLLAFNFQRLY